jgi:integrase
MKNENDVKGCLIERKGRYYVTLYYYVDGQRLTETKATGIAVNSHKKREAERIKNDMIMEKQQELENTTHVQNLHSFADCFERWVEYKTTQIESTTATSYRDGSKTVIDYFRQKNIMIEELQPKDLLAYYNWALENGRRHRYKEDSNTGLKRRTVRDQATLVKGFLNDAVVQGIITVNPADKVSVPRVKEDNTKEIAYMDLEQAKSFLDFVKSTPRFHVLYYISELGFYYGLRRSELLGLRWDAIDFENGMIEIKHTVVRIAHTVEHRDNVKTKSSHRYLPLIQAVRDCLTELKDCQKQHDIYSDSGYIFLWEDGREYNPDYISKLFVKAVKACPDVPKDITLHGLRHSCCAILFQKGWDLAEVQNWLGHSDIAVTANIYNHVSIKWKNEHGQKIDNLFG